MASSGLGAQPAQAPMQAWQESARSIGGSGQSVAGEGQPALRPGINVGVVGAGSGGDVGPAGLPTAGVGGAGPVNLNHLGSFAAASTNGGGPAALASSGPTVPGLDGDPRRVVSPLMAPSEAPALDSASVSPSAISRLSPDKPGRVAYQALHRPWRG